jgi:dTDP-4-amino-4,6-dideoxygalactose transaminase
MGIPLFDTKTPLLPLGHAIREAVDGVLDDGRFILGPEVDAFEAEFAAACGTNEAVGVANGTDALELALRAMGVGPGDEVVVPSFTFFATAEAVPPTGATPVFCDVDLDTACVTAETVKAVMTPRTKAVVAVDLFGNPAPVKEIEALGIPVLEDAAQAAGATLDGVAAGSLGTAATFSFFPSKNLGAFGDGGAVVTGDPQIAARVRTLRFHGSRDKRSFDEIGRNSRLDEIQAAILRVELPMLDEWAEGRRRAADHYRVAGLNELIRTVAPVKGASPAWHLFVGFHEHADAILESLNAKGIEARGYYRTPVHRQPAMSEWATGVDLPVTDELARTNLALPMSPVLTADQAVQVTEAVRDALEQIG